jgi:putative hemolysin
MEVSIIIICLLLSAFFSGMEIAFVSSNKVYLGIEKLQEGFVAKILTKITEKPSMFIASMLVGNNIALVVYGFMMGDLIMSFCQSVFSDLCQYVYEVFCLPAYFFYQLFYFISTFIIWISDFILKKFFKTEGDQIQLFFSKSRTWEIILRNK